MITNTTIGRYGRFANALFQIAAVIGIARKSNQDFGFLPFFNHDHKERFGSTEDVDLEKYFVNPLPALPDMSFEKKAYAWGYHDIVFPRVGNFDIEGHFQSERYFNKSIDEVRHYLTMKDEFPTNDQACVHVRLGDYDDLFHTRLKMDYYTKAIGRLPANAHIFVFSDDLDTAQNMFTSVYGKSGPVSRFNFVRGGYIESFKLMKSFKYYITGNSSFSLMAAILSQAPGKKIICPAKWFGPSWHPETKDLYPENAIVI